MHRNPKGESNIRQADVTSASNRHYDNVALTEDIIYGRKGERSLKESAIARTLI